MGAGKEAPEGGDGGGKGAETPPPLPVVLGMELHCAGCAKKVVKSVKRLPGVKSVVADVAANRVVVEGTADAAALKARIETKTKRSVEVVSGGGVKKAAAEPKRADKGGGGGEKRSPDMDGGGEAKGNKEFQAPPKEEKEKKQPAEEKKPTEETVLLKIRLHCEHCADRIKRRVLKIKGVKDVVARDIAKDEVKVTGTMDVAAMLVYLREKLGRTVEAVALGKKDDGDDDKKKDKGGGGGDNEKKIDKATAAGSDVKQDKGKGVEVAGTSRAAVAASMSPAPAEANTYHVSPYGYGAYPQPPPPSYYNNYGGNADGAGYSNAGGPAYYQNQAPGAGAYYQQQAPDAGAYYQQQAPQAVPYYQQQAPGAGAAASYHQPAPEAVPYYQHPGADADADHNPQPYPYPYRFDMAPAPQMFSDENPNGCSVM